MAKCRLAVLTVCFPFALVCAITWDAAPSTTFDVQSLSTGRPSQKPRATPAPSVIINGTRYEPPNLCGYVEYSSANSYTCGGNNTCLWNSKLGLVGCGSPTSVNYYTSCVPWRHMQDCNSSCLADPRILRCSTPTPYCVTPIVGPHHNYSMFGCEATRVFGRYKVHLTYAGQNTTGHLPRYLGDDEIITYGTRAHKNYTFTPTTPTSSALNTNPLGIVETLSVPVTTDATHGNWSGYGGGNCSTCHSGRNKWEVAQLRNEIIAGSVIGGFMFLIAAVLFIWLFLAWRKLKSTKVNQEVLEPEPKDVRLQELGRDSFLTSEASGSTVGASGETGLGSRTMSPVRELGSRGTNAEEARSPISEVGSAYLSRGTSTGPVYDDLYDDEDTVPRSAVPLIVVSEAPTDDLPSEGLVDELNDTEDGEHEGHSADPNVPLSEDVKEGSVEEPAEASAEERIPELDESMAEPEPPSDASIRIPPSEGSRD